MVDGKTDKRGKAKKPASQKKSRSTANLNDSKDTLDQPFSTASSKVNEMNPESVDTDDEKTPRYVLKVKLKLII